MERKEERKVYIQGQRQIQKIEKRGHRGEREEERRGL
jgi:hypothetical protein